MSGDSFQSISNPVLSYVQNLRKASGGFAATRRLPATIQDTFHAVSIFTILADCFSRADGIEVCRSDSLTKKYLARLWPGNHLDIKSVHQLHQIADMLEADVDLIQTRDLAEEKCRKMPTLQNLYYTVQIMNPKGRMAIRKRYGEEYLRSLLPQRYTCEELWMWMELTHALEVNLEPKLLNRLLRWFAECQTPDGGFGFLPQTTSFIENSHFCLKSLFLNNAVCLNPIGARLFIFNCLTRKGGFSRKARAAPFLEATYHAMSALSILRSFSEGQFKKNKY